jgi:hypothetical protein
MRSLSSHNASSSQFEGTVAIRCSALWLRWAYPLGHSG